MLPAKFRLKINEAKSRTWRNKKQVYTPLFKVIYRFRQEGKYPKIGFIISGKIGKATARNRVRRLLGEALRSKISRLPKNVEAIFISDAQAKDADYDTISSNVDKVLSRFNKPTT